MKNLILLFIMMFALTACQQDADVFIDENATQEMTKRRSDEPTTGLFHENAKAISTYWVDNNNPNSVLEITDDPTDQVYWLTNNPSYGCWNSTSFLMVTMPYGSGFTISYWNPTFTEYFDFYGYPTDIDYYEVRFTLFTSGSKFIRMQIRHKIDNVQVSYQEMWYRPVSGTFNECI